MSIWKLVIPEAATNMVLNPSAETTGNYTAEAGTTITRSTARSKYGLWCYRIQTDNDNEGIEITLSALTNAIHYVTVRAYGTVPTSWDWSLDDTNWTVPTELESIDDNWTLYGAVFSAAQSNGSTKLSMHQEGAGALTTWHLDGIQVEAAAYWTTYVDGDQDGCEWNGVAHASTSTRSAQSRAGGRVKDFTDDYTFYTQSWAGWGMVTHNLSVDDYALLPGGQLNGIKIEDREFVLIGLIKGSSLSNLHSLRDTLTLATAPDRYPKTGKGWQPVTLRYEGATTHKQIRAHYAGGLEGGRREGFNETVALRFRAADPYWYEIGQSSALLDSNDTATLRYLGGRLKSTGQWDDLGLTANPDANGTIHAICVASDGSVYFGGDWTNLDGGTIDNAVRFDPSDQSWNALVGAGEVTDIVYSIIEGPDGTIYLGGAFTNIGDAEGDFIVSYDPSGDSWTSLGDPSAGAANFGDVRCMAFDSVGDLYVGGQFDNFADVAAADCLVKWDVSASAWVAVGAPGLTVAGGDFVYAVAVDSQDNVVVSGDFANFAGDADADGLARWNGTAWADLGSGTQANDVRTLLFGPDDMLYIGGNFLNQGGEAACDYVCMWNGRQFLPMGTVDGIVQDLAIGSDGRIFASGWDFGGGDIAAWNGAAWEIWDIGSSTNYRVAVGPADPVMPTSYDVWAGFASTAATEIGGTATVTNDGTASQHPVFKVYRTGGTSAALYSLRNEDTGKVLMFNYSLLDGETLTVDCRPDKQSITSSFFGERPDAILANSDFGSFVLQADANQITCFVDVAGAPTVTAWLEWGTVWKGAD